MKNILVLCVIAGIGWLVLFHKPKAKWPGFPVKNHPVQTTNNLPGEFSHGDFQVKPLANYSITGVVLGTERYRYDGGAKIAPIDIGLAWGPMSIASVLNDLSFSLNGRFLEYSFRGEPPLDQRTINRNSSNNHCIPADDKVRRDLFAIRRHELVTLEGLLVEVRGPGGYSWRSSLTRDDTRGGACELLYVTRVTRRKLGR